MDALQIDKLFLEPSPSGSDGGQKEAGVSATGRAENSKMNVRNRAYTARDASTPTNIDNSFCYTDVIFRVRHLISKRYHRIIAGEGREYPL
jgi:hypothetical protein